MYFLHIISIFLEAIITILGILLATQKRKSYGWAIALTFGIYVFYDAATFFSVSIRPDVLYSIFFIATISAFWSVWRIYKQS